MRLGISISVALLAILAAGCATTTVSNREIDDPNAKIARPDRILVYEFATTSTEVHAESALQGKDVAPSTAATPEELDTLRQLSDAVEKELVSKIREMGLNAVRAEGEPDPNVGDIVIHGAFVSMDQGSAVERLVIGFGKGAPELHTMVEGYLMTEQGLRRLGSGEIDAGGTKTPGMALPVAVALLTDNPIGIIVGGGVKAYGELSGSAKIEGAGKRSADEIAKQLRPRFEQEGWIAPSSS